VSGPAIRVLVVDDDPLVRAGLQLMLGGADDIEVVGEAADGGEVVAAVERDGPHVVLMDVRMPGLDGVGAVRALRQRDLRTPVIMLTTFRSDAVVLASLRAGASGFLLKHTPPDEIVDAVRRAAAGQPTVSPAVLRQLIDHVAGTEGDGVDVGSAPAQLDDDRSDPLAVLTGREREVADAVADGLANPDIAAQLHLSLGSVKAHISSALAKLGFDNRVQLAIAAHEARPRSPG
jgi:DNA-binding NarL/FixJ family response regulator